MHVTYKLDPSNVGAAADSVFLWLSFYLFIAMVSIYKTAVTVIKRNNSDNTQERFTEGGKLLTGTMIIFGLFIALAASGDVFRLALTFPSWGILILLLVLFLVWIVARWFFLSRDDIAEYTIEATHRSAVDERWSKQAKSISLLLKELPVWFCGDVFAIGWLMHLTNRGASSLLSFLHS